MLSQPLPAVADRWTTAWSKPLGVVALFTFLGPAVGGGLLALFWAMAELLAGEATAAGAVLLAGLVMAPLVYVGGLPAGLACGVVAGMQTRREGRPGWWGPVVTAAAGAAVMLGRTEWLGWVSVALIFAHLGAATACTALARAGLRPKA